MRLCFTILILGLLNSASAQEKFDSLQVEKILTALPRQDNQVHSNEDIIKAIEAVDRKFRRIIDTLYGYKSLRHTILQSILIETNDSSTINPLTFGEKINTSSIIFNNAALNAKVDSLAKNLKKTEKKKLYEYLKTNFDHFSTKEKKLSAQPVRIRYVKIPNDTFARVGIDIYGAHFLWTIDKTNNWDIIKVERLWVY